MENKEETKTESLMIKALISAQSKMKPAKKSGRNPFTKSNYSTLEDVYQAIKEPLAESGLAYSHTFRLDGERTIIVTTLMHESGEKISSEAALITNKLTPQEMGTCITYFKRYMLQAILGLPSEDDDGNEAEKKTSESKQLPKKSLTSNEIAKDRPTAFFRPDQVKLIYEEANGDYGLLKYIAKFHKTTAIELITAEKFDEVMDFIKNHKEKEAKNVG